MYPETEREAVIRAGADATFCERSVALGDGGSGYAARRRPDSSSLELAAAGSHLIPENVF